MANLIPDGVTICAGTPLHGAASRILQRMAFGAMPLSVRVE